MRLAAISSYTRKPVVGALVLAFSGMFGGLNGCQNAGREDSFGKGFLAPQELMRLTHNQAQLPILDKLSGLDEPNEEFATARNVIADDLKVDSADYVIGKNDLLSISLTEVQPGTETVKTTRVSESGNIILPLIGQIPAAGYTEAKLNDAIVEKYRASGIVKEAQVSVTVIEARQRTFQVRGAVARPGQYQIIQSDFRVLDALVLAGDTTVPNIEYLYVIRPAPRASATQPTAPSNTVPANGGPVNPVPGGTAPATSPAPATTPAGPPVDGGGLLEPKPKVDTGLTPAERTDQVPTTPKPDTQSAAPKLNNLPQVRTSNFARRTAPFGSPKAADVKAVEPKPAMPTLDDLAPAPASSMRKADPTADDTIAAKALAAPETQPGPATRPVWPTKPKIVWPSTTKPEMKPDLAPPDSVDVPKLVELPMERGFNKSDAQKLDEVPLAPSPATVPAAAPATGPTTLPATMPAAPIPPAATLEDINKPVGDRPVAPPAPADRPIDGPMDDKPAPVFVNGGQAIDTREKPVVGDGPNGMPDKGKDFEFVAPIPESDSTIIKVPLQALLHGDLKYNIIIKPQDTMMIPIPEAGEFYMGGHVARVGVYSLTGRNITLKQAIISAGMLDEVAIPERTDIIRRVGRDREVFVRVNLVKVFEGKQPDFFLKPYDIIQVGTNALAPFIAAIRNSFRITYGFGFLYDRNFYIDPNTQTNNNNNASRRR